MAEGEQKEKQLLEKLQKNPYVLVYALFAIIAWIGYSIRIKNLPHLIDVSNGKYIPLALDPFAFLRYVQEIVATGSLAAVDTMRYYPLGFSGVSEFSFLSHAIAYLYKFLHIFNPSITVEYVHVIYPALAFVAGLLFFFFFLKKTFNWQVALVGSAFLTVLPAYLYRTMAGFSDKEALAMVFMYFGMLFFVCMLLEKKQKMSLMYAALAGIGLGCMWILWGGVTFLIIAIASLVLVMVLFDRINKKEVYSYSLFLAVSLFILWLGFPQRASIAALTTSTSTLLLFVALAAMLVHYFVFKKYKPALIEKYRGKVPDSFLTFGFVILAGIVLAVVVYGPSFIVERFANIYSTLVSPFSFDRWALTVAEAQQPYFTDWIGQFTMRYLWVVFLGAVLLFYETFKELGKKAYYLTVAFGVFIALFATSRYSAASPVFNGVSQTAIVVYIGSLIGFVGFFLYVFYTLYKNDKERFEVFKKIRLEYLFVLLLFIFLLVGARSAIRLLFIFAPITAVLVGFAFYQVGYYAFTKIKDKRIFYVVLIVLVICGFIMLNGFYKNVSAQAAGTGPSYSQQWQVGMDWVRENTPTDAVFAHWWDYGYWVQTGGERATLSDGGNARGAINHFIGRHLLTGHSEREALELLAANEATHVLMIGDEIGKYGAFSSIGADANYDRFSWIPHFGLDESQTQEDRDGVNFVYTGGTAFDDDVTYGDLYFPAQNSGIAAFLVPTTQNELGQITAFGQPTAVVSANGLQHNVPVKCLFYNGVEHVFEEGIEGCLMLIPSQKSGEFNPYGSSLYLSGEVWSTVFAKIYLFNEDWDYFEQVYSDEQNVPLMSYEGRLIGPLKIWEVSYPDDLEIPAEYYGTEIPAEVTAVR
jgi:asparagine N-glycosylation enzyme membrane subunit Stt3